MVICFDCSRQTKTEIDQLLAIGQYANMAELIAVAVSNLTVLHARVSTEGAVVIESTDLLDPPTAQSPRNLTEPAQTSAPAADSAFTVTSTRPANLAELPDSDSDLKGGDMVPLSRWIFGQFNRLLPAKLNCRMLVQMLRESPNGVALNEAQSGIAKRAAVFGDYLTALDRRLGVDRDDAFATAFPTTGPDGDKGRLRYASQFVASSNKAGQLSGLLIELKLVNVATGKEPRLLLTEPGWEFARLANPLIDRNVAAAAPTKFTEEEQRFLLRHINTHVPTERFAYKAILNAIKSGNETPTDLDAALTRYVGTANTLTPSFLSTQRSGAVSRMSDLGLVLRVREGVKVRYQATEAARMFLDRL